MIDQRQHAGNRRAGLFSRVLAAGEPDQRAQASRLLGLLMDALGYRA
jgi:hypothetical protein